MHQAVLYLSMEMLEQVFGGGMPFLAPYYSYIIGLEWVLMTFWILSLAELQ